MDERHDYILLDDDLEIMVVPHLVREHKWITYDEIDEMRKSYPRFPSMIQVYNDQVSWEVRMGLAKKHLMRTRKEVGE